MERSFVLGFVLLMVLFVFPPLSAIGSDVSPTGSIETENCQRRLDATLAAMEDAPLLKEELATGIMWMRLKAKQALTAGKIRECNNEIARVEKLLDL